MRGQENLPGLSLPPTVVAGHLRACADELALTLRGDGPAATLGELSEVVTQLVAGQHALAHALAGLAGRMDARNPVLAAVPNQELDVLVEVLQAAACAVSCSAEELADAEPTIEFVSETADPDTCI
ncbi:hypothetical protein [Amycolatopsis benzoatilytica]|uniref:hypothetical protein n=1 Tax=Amycolatopsis benzoatilytica TaxID=346045 RepID=UPI0003741EEC|nr:hypothetical protein [Amycolatopsis benzoatilytica]